MAHLEPQSYYSRLEATRSALAHNQTPPLQPVQVATAPASKLKLQRLTSSPNWPLSDAQRKPNMKYSCEMTVAGDGAQIQQWTQTRAWVWAWGWDPDHGTPQPPLLLPLLASLLHRHCLTNLARHPRFCQCRNWPWHIMSRDIGKVR